jgi:sterol 24-C-methyltransferase
MALVQKLWHRVVNASTGKGVADKDALAHEQVGVAAGGYLEMFNEKAGEQGVSSEKIEERKTQYAKLVNAYYDLATDFYEYGWGQSFHFAPRFRGEAFEASIARHEHYLALRLGLGKGLRVLDAGCGVGGPMREIARFSGAHVTGVNNNRYQVGRSNLLIEKAGLGNVCRTVHGDFMNLPFAEASFDRVYAIEATCHAPDKVGCYSQMFKVLKPGGLFAGYEWVMTDKYDERDPAQRRIKHLIEKGDGLPDLARPKDVVQGLRDSGFEVIEYFDLAETAPEEGQEIAWYAPMQPGFSLSQIKLTKVGRFLTQSMVDVLESLHIAPKGTSDTHKMLIEAAEGLVAGGEQGIFTPMYFFIARKPLA